MTSRTDDVPDLTADPHTLDEYARALAFAAEKTPCKAEDVRRMVWGSKGGRDATELALDELVNANRADRVFGGRWKPRAATVPLVPGAMFSPMVSNAPHGVEVLMDGSDTVLTQPWGSTRKAVARGDHETAPESPDPAGKTPDGVIGGGRAFLESDLATVERMLADREGEPEFARFGLEQRRDRLRAELAAMVADTPDDPDSEVEPAEGNGVAATAPETPSAVAGWLCTPPGLRWEPRSTEKGFRLVRPADGWVAATIEPCFGGLWVWDAHCGELRGRGGSATGQDTAAEQATNRLLARRADWPAVAADAPQVRTIDDIAAKYAGGPLAEIRNARELVSGMRGQRDRLARAVDELDEAADHGRDLLAELDRMIGGSK